LEYQRPRDLGHQMVGIMAYGRYSGPRSLLHGHTIATLDSEEGLQSITYSALLLLPPAKGLVTCRKACRNGQWQEGHTIGFVGTHSELPHAANRQHRYACSAGLAGGSC